MGAPGLEGAARGWEPARVPTSWPPRIARGCVSPRLAAPQLRAALAIPASKGRHVPAACAGRGLLAAGRGGSGRGGAGRAGRGRPGRAPSPSPRPAPGQDARRHTLKHGGGSVQVDQLSHRSEGSSAAGDRGERGRAAGKPCQGFPLPLPGPR